MTRQDWNNCFMLHTIETNDVARYSSNGILFYFLNKGLIQRLLDFVILIFA